MQLRFRHTHAVIMSPARRCMRAPLQFGCWLCVFMRRSAAAAASSSSSAPAESWVTELAYGTAQDRTSHPYGSVLAAGICLYHLSGCFRCWTAVKTRVGPAEPERSCPHGPETTAPPHPSLSAPLNIHSHDLSVKLDTPVPGETDENLHSQRCHVINICMSFRWEEQLDLYRQEDIHCSTCSLTRWGPPLGQNHTHKPLYVIWVHCCWRHTCMILILHTHTWLHACICVVLYLADYIFYAVIILLLEMHNIMVAF